ncbi:SLC13 family permease [Enterococcus hulanensis]|uniref:SLC13 family permease n=1 Tax=Enterococcus hulanensis TaxID=2559929 RepID=UPI00288F0790|nr:SLC13 family permease [Enterococcus hulanensis]MDT2662498.1 SLC13 family permease [Enterococcus hulanensis]
MKKAANYFSENKLLSISLLLAIISCLVGRFSADFIDYKVIFSLFGLMLLIQGFEQVGLLRFVAQKLLHYSKNSRQLVQLMLLLSLIGSMFLTNDVAILTLLPIYFKLLSVLPKFKGRLLGSVLIIVAANLGSSFFPFGNPQNLYLYDYYHVPLGQFLSWMSLVLLVSFISLGALTLLVAKDSLAEIDLDERRIDRKETTLLAGLMLVMVLVVLDVLPYQWVIPIVALIVVFYRRELFKTVDYGLLLTFVCFFIIVGNIGEAQFIKSFLQALSGKQIYLAGLGLSQVISNVPAAFLIAPFTTNQQAVILGVNIGGLGTLLASLANLIGYNLFRAYYPAETKKFFGLFSAVNFGLLVFLGMIFYFFIH